MKTNLFIIAVSLILALGVGEFIARSFIPQNIIIDDPILGHRRAPNTGYDERGFKNDHVLENAAVVAIGDSQTEGNNAGINESWPQVMGSTLDVPVYQMALGGYSPIQYAALLDDALALSPQLVIVGFYSGNDTLEATRLAYSNEHWAYLRFADFIPTGDSVEAVPKDVSIVFKHGLTVDSWRLRFLKLRNWFRSKSQLYTLAGRGTRKLRERIGLAETPDERTKRVLTWAKQVENQKYGITYEGAAVTTLLSPTYRLDVVDLSNLDAAEGLRIGLERLSYIQERTASMGTSLLLLYIPTKEAVYVDFMAASDESIPSLLARYAEKEAELRRRFFTFCEESQIECFDVAPALLAGLKAGEIIYPEDHDGHPTAAGYRRMGQAVAGFVDEQLLLQ